VEKREVRREKVMRVNKGKTQKTEERFKTLEDMVGRKEADREIRRSGNRIENVRNK
jgi:hypothetical protein